ncbi:hypothetical protein IEQ34_013367 [Dendrobium chrysotoxum]|uniref:MADS-box domain-containing protein n=1 Tax=Dendrobium chrysotoxum TaxID=161865 RepID=A0AAV7GP28_DENCH|nr:hypothetical protein IEQ34_013367 [Dendrobium chrysotoxum]
MKTRTSIALTQNAAITCTCPHLVGSPDVPASLARCCARLINFVRTTLACNSSPHLIDVFTRCTHQVCRTAMGRQKIEIKKIENEDARLVSFSKRRAGLFNKASCLATLCGIDLAVIVLSPAGMPYSFGSPRVNQVIDRFLSDDKAPIESDLFHNHHTTTVQALSHQCVELEGWLEIAHEKRKALEERLRMTAPIRDLEEMGMEELLVLKGSLDQMKEMTDMEMLTRIRDGAAFNNQIKFPISS